MESGDRPLKRVKTSVKEKPFAFDFNWFLSDLVEEGDMPRSPHHKDFYSLFESDLKRATNKPQFSEVSGVLLLTFAVSRELLRPIIAAKVPVVVASDCSTNIDCAYVESDEQWPNLLKFYPKKQFFPHHSAAFHPKLALIKFPTFLRVVVGSGNLLEQDWLVWENAFICRDYPLSAPSKTLSPLAAQLRDFLTFSFGSKFDYVTSFIGLDFRNYAMVEEQFVLIASLPGRWHADQGQHSGLTAIHKIMLSRPPSKPFTPDNIRIYYLTSSLGTITWKFIIDFASCFLVTKDAKTPLSFPERDSIASRFAVLYPSGQFVEKSRFGPKSASCLFLDKNQYDSYKFQKTVLRQLRKTTKAAPLIPHVKLFIIAREGELFSDDTVLYLGSHNFTTAALGRFENGGACFVNNYELGVIVPPMPDSAKAKAALLSMFEVDYELAQFDKYVEPYFSKR